MPVPARPAANDALRTAPLPSIEDDEPPLDLIDAAADAAAVTSSDEAYASAPPVPPAWETPRPPANDPATPGVAAAAARVPESTQALLDELFKAKITAVRRITRDQLR
jgi:hypothetical protein